MAAPTLVTSVLTGGSSNHATSSEEVNGVATDFVSEGVVGSVGNTSGVAPATGSFAVNASNTPDANVNIATGVAYVTATPTSQNSQKLRVQCSVAGTLAISANSSGSTKYDWIYISVSASNAANPNVAGDNVSTIVASRSTSATSDDGTPPTYGYPIAVVTVANGFSTITNGNIRDVRTQAVINATSDGTSQDWYSMGVTPSTVTYNGNRSYDLVFTNMDLTSYLSPGMRLKFTRLVTASTSSFSFDGTNDYYNKTSPAGMTFTDDFAAGAWVYMTAYGTTSPIISRYNGTSGWELSVDTSGAIFIRGYNASSANYRDIRTYQSIPLNRWVHIAAQLDMSTYTASSTTCYVMIDGVNVPAFLETAGTNPTALIQAGNLEIGSRNSGASVFPGYITGVFVSSAKITQANIRTLISQGITAALVSSNNIISAFGNGSTTDINTNNANNITSQNGATTASVSPHATNAFGTATGTTDYAVITKAAYSTNTTLTVQVPEGCTIPTSGGISAVSYSTQSSPYGMPTAALKWKVLVLNKGSLATTSNATYGSFQSGGMAMIVPVGTWRVGQRGGYTNATTTTVYFNLSDVSLTGLSSAVGIDTSPIVVGTKASAAANTTFSANAYADRSLVTATTFTIQTSGATTSAAFDGVTGTCELYAEFGLL